MARGLEFSFNWIFAILVGGFILFLALFTVSKLLGQGQYQLDTTTAKRIDVLLNPLQTGVESEKLTPLIFASQTRVYNRCDVLDGEFGKQYISVAQKSGFGDWPEPGSETALENKYLFSDEFVEGKEMYVFSQSFSYPFPTATLLVLLPQEKSYCFVNPPRRVEKEVQALGHNLFVDACPQDSVRFCFGSSGQNCDAIIQGTCIDSVNCDDEFVTGSVQRGTRKIYYSEELIYAALFSDTQIYECQSQRLMKRVAKLSEIYQETSFSLNGKGCTSGLEQELGTLQNEAENFKRSEQFESLQSIMQDLEEKNQVTVCRLW